MMSTRDKHGTGYSGKFRRNKAAAIQQKYFGRRTRRLHECQLLLINFRSSLGLGVAVNGDVLAESQKEWKF